jgi:hypothetical protein
MNLKILKIVGKVIAAAPAIVAVVKPIVAKKKRQVDREDSAGA